MSIFVRPDSPPPRQPSPDFIPTPLPSPRRPRVRTSSHQSKARANARIPVHPPGLEVPVRNKRLLIARSCDHIGEAARRMGEEHNDFSRSTQSSFLSSPSATIRSLPTPSPPRSPNVHTRAFSSSSPYRSPPPSPSHASPPPPVPPIPTLLLNATDMKPILQPRPLHASSVRFPGLDTDQVELPSLLSRKNCRSPPAPTPAEKHRSLGVTCMRFFSLRNTNQRASRTTAV